MRCTKILFVVVIAYLNLQGWQIIHNVGYFQADRNLLFDLLAVLDLVLLLWLAIEYLSDNAFVETNKIAWISFCVCVYDFEIREIFWYNLDMLLSCCIGIRLKLKLDRQLFV